MSFTGEERGLLGSARYVRDPLIPLDKTIAMLNMDMVGRMKDDKLTVYGIDTATRIRAADHAAQSAVRLQNHSGTGRLWPERSCVVFREEDSGAVLLHGPACRLSSPDRHGRQARRARHASRRRFDDRRGGGVGRGAGKAALFRIARRRFGHPTQQSGDRPYFGSIPDFGVESPGGYAISGVTKGGPAEVGGLKGGDIIIRFGDTKIAGLDDFDGALRQHRARRQSAASA